MANNGHFPYAPDWFHAQRVMGVARPTVSRADLDILRILRRHLGRSVHPRKLQAVRAPAMTDNCLRVHIHAIRHAFDGSRLWVESRPAGYALVILGEGEQPKRPTAGRPKGHVT